MSEIENGETFKIGDIEFIKFYDENGETIAVTKECIYDMEFGSNNNFAESEVLKRLMQEFLPKIIEIVGDENICYSKTDLTTLDGLKPYDELVSKITLPTFDFYRANVEIFDKYKLDCYWWLATPDTAQPHYEPRWITCVSPSGDFRNYFYNLNIGVRPFLRFVSSIFVSRDK